MPPRDSRRADRVGEGVREEVARFIQRDLRDPRLVGLLTVTGVEMAHDRRSAKVFVSVMGATDEQKGVDIELLQGAAPSLRGKIGRALGLQFAPELHFRLDESVARAARIETLLAGLRDDKPQDDDLH